MKTFSFAAIISLTVAASLLASHAFAQSNEVPGNLSKSDFKFACEAATGGKTEVELGRIATQKASAASVKRFGEQMVTDHSKAGSNLERIAVQHNAVLPTRPTAKQQKEIGRLSGLSGAEFDREYVKLMLEDHKKDLKEFQSAAKSADAADLKSFATETSTVVQHHLEMVKALDTEGKFSK